MAIPRTTFVFIDEDQKNKYSKHTLSVINAQVAKYCRKQRLEPHKSHSAPSSPSETEGEGEGLSTKKISLKQKGRTRSDTYHTTAKLRTPRKTEPFEPEKLDTVQTSRRQDLVRHESGEAISPGTTATNEFQWNNSTSSANLTDLLENLCRITKLPTYQAFPFFLSLEERKLAHYWFTEVLPEDFGTSKLHLEDSFQGSLTKYPLAFQVPLRWIIAHSAQRLHNKTGSQPLATVYRSQQRALTKLQNVLIDTNTPTDEAVSSIQYSIVHNPESRKIHLRGMDAMIEARGGLESVLQQCTITQAEHIFLQYTFADFDVTEQKDLEDLKTEFFQALLAIQDASTHYIRIKNRAQSCWSEVGDSDSHESDLLSVQERSYIEQREHVFGSESAIGQLVRQKYDRSTSMMGKSRLFGALYHLATILLEYDTTEQKSTFLARLEKSADAIARTCLDPHTGLLKVMPGTSIFMVGHVTRQVHENSGSQEPCKIGVKSALTGIAALKIFGLLQDPIREKLQTYLQGWLMGIETSPIDSDCIDTLSNLIKQSWVQKRRSHPLDPKPQGFDTIANNIPDVETSLKQLLQDYLQLNKHHQYQHVDRYFLSTGTLAV